MIIDSHCHLDYPELFDQLDDVLQRAKSNNVNLLLTICTTVESYEKIKLIVNKYNNVYGTFGIHPHETEKYSNVNLDYIIKAAKENKKVIGIGETGLDYYYTHSSKKIQKDFFVEHIKASQELDIPLIVHSRNAETDTLDILKSELKNSNIKTIIHCFTGSKEFATKLVDLNCYISFSGIVTFKNSQDLLNTASVIPENNLLIETDSPYLAPTPNRGKQNEPSFIIHTLEKLAAARETSVDNLANATTYNFNKLFNLN
jgi:TatD DNase family protein